MRKSAIRRELLANSFVANPWRTIVRSEFVCGELLADLFTANSVRRTFLANTFLANSARIRANSGGRLPEFGERSQEFARKKKLANHWRTPANVRRSSRGVRGEQSFASYSAI